MTSTRSLPAQPADAATSKPKRFGLSWVQIIAAGFASITATVILSFFSISGTLIGAAVFSMASAVGNAVYGSSLRKTQNVVLDVLPVGKADPASPTVVLPVTESEVEAIEDAVEEGPSLPAAAPAAVVAARAPGTLSRRAWKRVAIFAVAIFAFVMAIVTGVELIAGRPLTDLLRGEQGTGTSLTGGGGRSVPTVTVVVTPSVTYTTPTVTQTAPPTTATTTPTTTETPTTTSPATGSPSTGESTGSGSATSGTPTPAQTSPR